MSQTIVQIVPAAQRFALRCHKVLITLNGEPYRLTGPVTVTQLLGDLKVDPRRVAVELNLVVLKRAAFETSLIQEGDQVEIVNFVGGGCA